MNDIGETHDTDLTPGEQTKVQHSFSYSDGFGREIQKKIQAEPGPLDLDDPNSPHIDPRWVGSGWTIFNNKGKPVRQYEPFFTDTHRFEFDVRIGVSPVLFYDPAERVVATLHPNHTWEKVVFDPWRQETWDVNDTVLQADPKDDPDVGDFFRRMPDADYLPTWHAQRQGGGLGPQEQDAAQKAAAHANTPAVAYLDTLGRTFLTIADNGPDGQYHTRIQLDIEGNPRFITDARGNRVMEYAYSMVGPEEEEERGGGGGGGGEDEGEDEDEEKQPDSHLIYQKSMDAGERWMLYSVTDNLIRSWDSRCNIIRTTYDALQRPTHLYVRQGEDDERLAEQTVYGEGYTDAEGLNLRGEVYRQYDGAGVVTNEAFDFKGNLLRSTRQVLRDYKNPVNWSLSPVLEYETFTSSTAYDALSRPIRLITPDGSEARHSYNEANLLEKVDVRLRGASEWTPFVLDIDYDAKGQRVLIEYANGVRTTYEYDSLTFRLIHLRTRRTADNALLQDLSYTYDPVGNITRIQDDAQQTIFFRNQVVTPSAAYEYDALYRLIRAEGRELAGQNADHQRDHTELPYMPIPHANDSRAMRRYVEEYEYDEVGNILRMIHRADNANWTRRYQYALVSNRLLSTSLPGDPDALTYSENHEYTARYHYDAHGNMVRMPHLPEIQWDYEDQMQQACLGGGGRAYYVYDADGERVRKVHEHNGSTVEERIYLGGYEIYRKRNGSGLMLERETLQVMDDEQRIALVETKTHDQGVPVPAPTPLTRYQLGNHLGSSSLELDGSGAVISYEEYHPYGTTAYHAARSGVEVSAKRYRYTGKERDEETGLNYHGARYYAPWLGRWISVDPAERMFRINLYFYTSNNPINRIDNDGMKDREKQQILESVETRTPGDPPTPTYKVPPPSSLDEEVRAEGERPRKEKRREQKLETKIQTLRKRIKKGLRRILELQKQGYDMPRELRNRLIGDLNRLSILTSTSTFTNKKGIRKWQPTFKELYGRNPPTPDELAKYIKTTGKALAVSPLSGLYGYFTGWDPRAIAIGYAVWGIMRGFAGIISARASAPGGLGLPPPHDKKSGIFIWPTPFPRTITPYPLMIHSLDLDPGPGPTTTTSKKVIKEPLGPISVWTRMFTLHD